MDKNSDKESCHPPVPLPRHSPLSRRQVSSDSGTDDADILIPEMEAVQMTKEQSQFTDRQPNPNFPRINEALPSVFMPVPEIDLEKLKSQGYDPNAYVKTSHGIAEAMKTIDDMRKNKRMALKQLDEDILNFASQPENIQSEALFKAKQKVKEMIFNALPHQVGASLHFCGSTINGCGTSNADIDLCWAIPIVDDETGKTIYPVDKMKDKQFFPQSILKESKALLEEKLGIEYVEFIKARVPILKFHMTVDDEYLTIDININNIAGIYNTFMIAHYSKIDDRFPILAKVFKTWGAAAEIIDPVNGYLNSYTMVVMVLHYLQCGVSPPVLPNIIALRPDLFDGTIDLDTLEKSYDLHLGIKMDGSDEIKLGDLLIGFIRYYSFFAYDRNGIILRLGCVEEKKTEDVFLLEEVYDRLTVPKNIKKNTMRDIKKIFIDAYVFLLREPVFAKFMDSSHNKGFLLQREFPSTAAKDHKTILFPTRDVDKVAFGDPLPQPAAFGDPLPQKAAFGDHLPQRAAFGDPLPQKVAFGDPQRAAFGDPIPQKAAFGDPQQAGYDSRGNYGAGKAGFGHQHNNGSNLDQ